DPQRSDPGLVLRRRPRRRQGHAHHQSHYRQIRRLPRRRLRAAAHGQGGGPDEDVDEHGARGRYDLCRGPWRSVATIFIVNEANWRGNLPSAREASVALKGMKVTLLVPP